ncbi:MAG: MFS transporter [Chloroflexota bacterium]|jgi:PAT family beta-lactamase induction signal transducer AmpG|nr:MFS transporter [Chloroflexota bacterium]
MPRNKFVRYLTFGSLYFTQGTILGFFAALNALYLLDNGLRMTDVGVFGFIALLPFVLKIGLGILSDRVNLFGMGHRKPYIFIGLIVQFACLVAAPFIDPGQYFWGYVAIAFTMQMGMALYDTCTDGLALDTTPVDEQGIIQGFMVGGRAVGSIAAASVVGFLAENVSWLSVFWVLAALTIIPVPFMLFVREEQRAVEKRFDWSAFKAFDRTTFLVGGMGLVMFMIILGANQLINPYLEAQFGISLSAAGMITSLWSLGVVGGSFVGGWLMRKFKVQRAMVIGVLLLSVTLLVLAFLITPEYGMTLAIAMVIFFGVAYGAYQTEYFAVAMRFVDPRIAASMYAILMAFTNVGQGIGMYLSGALADLTGFSTTFLILLGINLLLLFLIPTVFRQKKEARKAA